MNDNKSPLKSLPELVEIVGVSTNNKLRQGYDECAIAVVYLNMAYQLFIKSGASHEQVRYNITSHIIGIEASERQHNG